MAARKRAPRKGWFRRCVDAVNRSGGAFDAEAVCGAALRRKRAEGYGRPRGRRGAAKPYEVVDRRERSVTPRRTRAAATRGARRAGAQVRRSRARRSR